MRQFHTGMRSGGVSENLSISIIMHFRHLVSCWWELVARIPVARQRFSRTLIDCNVQFGYAEKPCGCTPVKSRLTRYVERECVGRSITEVDVHESIALTSPQGFKDLALWVQVRGSTAPTLRPPPLCGPPLADLVFRTRVLMGRETLCVIKERG